jgi:hypothetical protein
MSDVVQAGALSAHALAMLVFAAIVFAVFISDRLPIATVSIGVLVLLPIGFVLFPLHTPSGPFNALSLFAGFGHPALVAICALMIVGQALVVTGALEPAARRPPGWRRSRHWPCWRCWWVRHRSADWSTTRRWWCC